MKDYQKIHGEKVIQTVKRRLERRNFQVIVCKDQNEAVTSALAMIATSDQVAFGGSETVAALDLVNQLKARGQVVIDRETAKTPEERHQMMRQSLLADVYLTSVNGIATDGQLVNIDSVGNRLAALIYGPERVLVFAGVNKIYGDLETTINIVRQRTAPINAQRLKLTKTPCVKQGLCGDCLVEECICSTIAVTRREKIAGRLTIFLINEEIGL